MGLLRTSLRMSTASLLGILLTGILAVSLLNLSFNPLLKGVLSDLYENADKNVTQEVDTIVNQTCLSLSQASRSEQVEQVKKLCDDPERVEQLKERCRAVGPPYPDEKTGEMCRRLLDGELETMCEELDSLKNGTVEDAMQDPQLKAACEGYQEGSESARDTFVQIALFFSGQELGKTPFYSTYDEVLKKRPLIVGALVAILLLLMGALYIICEGGVTRYAAEVGKIVANAGIAALLLPGLLIGYLTFFGTDTSGVLASVISRSADVQQAATTLFPIVLKHMITTGFIVGGAICLVCGGIAWFAFSRKARQEDESHG